MLAKQANTNGYKWVQNSTHCGNYIVLSSDRDTCLILPERGSSATNFQKGSQKTKIMIVVGLIWIATYAWVWYEMKNAIEE